MIYGSINVIIIIADITAISLEYAMINREICQGNPKGLMYDGILRYIMHSN